MKAKIGDVYTIYNNRLRLYTACQITNVIEDKGDAICLYLDWTGESPLHLVQMENLQPLYMDFMYWERQLCIANVDIDVPAYFNKSVDKYINLTNRLLRRFYRGFSNDLENVRNSLLCVIILSNNPCQKQR